MASPKVAAILPAYNEGPRLRGLLAAVTQSNELDEIWVVCDGCSDDTAQIARSMTGVQVLVLEKNVGKAGAMLRGAQATPAEVLVFLDADLIGLEPEHVTALLGPVLYGPHQMSVGLFHNGGFLSDLGHRLFPSLSGQRAVRRSFFLRLPNADHLGMGVEVALNQLAKQSRCPIARVPLAGVSNSHKEAKFGLVPGLIARAKMYRQIARAWARQRQGLRIGR